MKEHSTMNETMKMALMCAVLAAAIAVVAVPAGMSETADGDTTPSVSISENIYAKVGEEDTFLRTITLNGAQFTEDIPIYTPVTHWFPDLASDVSNLKVTPQGLISPGDNSAVLKFEMKGVGPESLSKTIDIKIPSNVTDSASDIIGECIYMLRDTRNVQTISEPEHLPDILSITTKTNYPFSEAKLSRDMRMPAGEIKIAAGTQLDLNGKELKVSTGGMAILSDNYAQFSISGGTVVQENAGEPILSFNQTATTGDRYAVLSVSGVHLKGTTGVTAVEYKDAGNGGTLRFHGEYSPHIIKPAVIEGCEVAFKGFKYYDLSNIEVRVNAPGAKTQLTADSGRTFATMLQKDQAISYFDDVDSKFKYGDTSTGTDQTGCMHPMVLRYPV